MQASDATTTVTCAAPSTTLALTPIGLQSVTSTGGNWVVNGISTDTLHIGAIAHTNGVGNLDVAAMK